MKKKILASVALLAVIVPSMALAQSDINTTFFDDLIASIIGVLNGLIPLFLALAAVYFLWGVLQFVSSGDDEEARKNARSRMVHGIIAIFVMVSLWGFVDVLVNAFNLENKIPEIVEVDPPSTP